VASWLHRNGQVRDLNTMLDAGNPLSLLVTLIVAHGINDTGQIVANGGDSSTNQGHAYLLTPLAAVPLSASV
jgi:hypothetical protein